MKVVLLPRICPFPNTQSLIYFTYSYIYIYHHKNSQTCRQTGKRTIHIQCLGFATDCSMILPTYPSLPPLRTNVSVFIMMDSFLWILSPGLQPVGAHLVSRSYLTGFPRCIHPTHTTEPRGSFHFPGLRNENNVSQDSSPSKPYSVSVKCARV